MFKKLQALFFNNGYTSAKSLVKQMILSPGEITIKEDVLSIKDYPFEPSIAYPNKAFHTSQIKAISLDFGMSRLYIEQDIIFVSAAHKEALNVFAEQYAIDLLPHSWNWDWLLEPYLDTELRAEDEVRLAARLAENGLDEEEVKQIRTEVGQQMYKYNFDTMLWEWCSLGLFDVLCAMQAKYDQAQFKDFYYRALEIDRRK